MAHHGMPRTLPVRLRQWATSRPTSSEPPPTRSRPPGRRSGLDEDGLEAGRVECRWQRTQLPDGIRDLVLDDERLRNELCWCVFDC